MNSIRRHASSLKDLSSSLLAEGKTIRIKAHGYSMFPAIKPGSLIIIEPISVKGKPVEGEIIAIKRERGLIVHRLTRIVIRDGVRYYIARGDSNAYADNPITIEKIAGRVVGSESTGENPKPADTRINKRPGYFLNRIRVIFIFLRKRPPNPLKGGLRNSRK
jgi:signal peptidase I